MALLIVGCGPSGWQPSGSIFLNEVTPIGMGVIDQNIWISDGDNNRVVVVTKDGDIVKTIDEIERPMHLDVVDEVAYVPSYGSDDILIMNGDNIDTLQVDVELEAPAGVSVVGDHIAIADFYNNQVAIYDGSSWKKIGKKGRGPLEFNYPTDVQIMGEKIYVADAYNNRIQILDLEGNHLKTIGEDQGLNAATGIYTDGIDIYITDFENDRILIFNMEGKLVQMMDQGLNKPTDLMIDEGRLYVANYNGKYISIYDK